MLRSSLLALALCAISIAACDSDVVRPDDDEEDPPPAELEARVEDCARVGSGVPLARVFGDGRSLATDGSSLFYLSETRPYALSIAGGEPQQLAPGDGTSGALQYADGFVYWTTIDVLYRVPATGGEPEALVELALGAEWVVAGDAILSTGPLQEPSPVYRSSLTTGETTEILAADPDHFVRGLQVDGDRLLVSSDSRLLSISVMGGDERVLFDGLLSGAGAPVVLDDDVYIGTHAKSDHYVARVSSSGDAGDPQRMVTGFPGAMAVDEDALYVSLIPVPKSAEEETFGELVQVPLAGGAPQRLSATASRGLIGFEVHGTALAVDDANVFMLDECTDGDPNEYRLVAIPKP